MKQPTHSNEKSAARPAFAISILAGGMSSRMGRDKSRLRFEGRSLVEHVKATASELGGQVRIIRRDLVPQCGPLGGVFTTLKTSAAEAELFLACDMPFVSTALLKKIVQSLGTCRKAAFTVVGETPGFPFALRMTALPIVEEQIQRGEFSLRGLAKALNAKAVSVSRRRARELFNINTPRDWHAAQAMPSDASNGRKPGKSDRSRRSH